MHLLHLCLPGRASVSTVYSLIQMCAMHGGNPILSLQGCVVGSRLGPKTTNSKVPLSRKIGKNRVFSSVQHQFHALVSRPSIHDPENENAEPAGMSSLNKAVVASTHLHRGDSRHRIRRTRGRRGRQALYTRKCSVLGQTWNLRDCVADREEEAEYWSADCMQA